MLSPVTAPISSPCLQTILVSNKALLLTTRAPGVGHSSSSMKQEQRGFLFLGIAVECEATDLTEKRRWPPANQSQAVRLDQGKSKPRLPEHQVLRQVIE